MVMRQGGNFPANRPAVEKVVSLRSCASSGQLDRGNDRLANGRTGRTESGTMSRLAAALCRLRKAKGRCPLVSKLSAARNQSEKLSRYWRIRSCRIRALRQFWPLRQGTKSTACLPSAIIGVIPIVGKLPLRRIGPHPLGRRDGHFEDLPLSV